MIPLVSNLEEFLNQKNIEVRIRHNFLINEQITFSDCETQNLDNAKKLVNKILCLPLHNKLRDKDVIRVSELISSFYKE